MANYTKQKRDLTDITNVAEMSWDDLKISPIVNTKGGAPAIIVYANGATITFTMNAQFCRLVQKDYEEYNYVVPHYSKKNNAIVFSFIDTYDALAVKLSKAGTTSRTFAMTAFFDHFNLPTPPHKIKLLVRQEKVGNLGDMWVLSLNDAK